MPKSALPEHINDPEEIEAAFPDDSQYGDGWFGRFYKWTHKVSKTWFCFSYRCTEPWAKWRKYPKVLFAVKGNGPWRVESDIEDSLKYKQTFLINKQMYAFKHLGYIDDILSLESHWGYLSRIQYYTRWHFAIQWPLMFSFHVYFKAKDVPIPGELRKDTDGKLFYFYWNHFDSDLVYWMFVSLFAGLTWK